MGITVSVLHATEGATVAAELPVRPVAVVDGRHERLRDTWPLHKPQVLGLIVTGVVLTGIFVAIGLILTGPFEDSALLRDDERIAERLAEARTPTWNTLSWWGSMLAETAVKIVVTALLSLVLLRMWKRWLEPVIVSVALILEASVFLAVTLIVGRPRPTVPHLDGSPIGSSFPSGHTAAAVVYTTLAVIVFWHTRNVWARIAVVLMSIAVPVVVGLSRMYRGMHHTTDTVAGALLGVVCVVVTIRIVMSSPEAREAFPEHAR
jgi:undecaprenyl-diphosphatase